MNQIILDSHISPLNNSKTVNLCILKKDIDRRFDKIRSLLGLALPNSNISMKKQFMGVACQTGQKQNNQSNTQKAKRRTFSQQENISLKQSTKNDNYPSSLACTRNKKKRQRNQPQEANDHNVRIRVSDYLSSEKKRICRRSYLKQTEPLISESEDEIQKIEFQNSQDDKIFKSIEFQLHSSFKSSRSFQQTEAPLCSYIISESASGQPSQSESTNSEQQEERRSFWAINQKQASTKKIRYTDRTSLPQTKRIIVSEECLMRATELVSHQVPKNRKQPSDCNLRSNLIKKIQEKYGEYYENN